MNNYKIMVPCHFGLESVLKFEVSKIGGENITADNGRVFFTGDDSVLAKANICIQSGERVLIVLNEFDALSFEDLFQGVKCIPWENYIGKTDAFPVKGWSLSSQLKSVPNCQSIIKKAVVERLKQAYSTAWFEETGVKIQIQFSILKDKVVILIDTSGWPLHKRGYRAVSNEAPIKETLAGGIVDFARVRSNSVVYDPFCGSGTFLIEAAYKAMNYPPGILRKFAAENYGFVKRNAFKTARIEAKEKINFDVDFKAFGYDIDQASVDIATENVRKTGLSDKITIKKADVANFHPQSENGIVICNPPYGERMLDFDRSNKLYEVMGTAFKQRDGYSYYIITSNEEFEQHFGRKANKKRKLYNGMLKCDLYMYY